MEKQALLDLIMAARNKSYDAESSISLDDLWAASIRLGEGAGLMQLASSAALILEDQAKRASV